MECIYGYKMNNGICECEDSNCTDCNKLNGKMCLSCQPGYEVNPTSKQCECKILNCTTCANNICTQCKLGYIVDNNECTCNIG